MDFLLFQIAVLDWEPWRQSLLSSLNSTLFKWMAKSPNKIIKHVCGLFRFILFSSLFWLWAFGCSSFCMPVCCILQSSFWEWQHIPSVLLLPCFAVRFPVPWKHGCPFCLGLHHGVLLTRSEQEKGERVLLRARKNAGRGPICQTVGASVAVPSVAWEDGGTLMAKKHFLLVYMASPLGQKRLSNGGRSSDLQFRPTLESLAPRV